jgi:hypothetical protein
MGWNSMVAGASRSTRAPPRISPKGDGDFALLRDCVLHRG